MRLVLDSNQYIFALGNFRKQSCEILLDTILDNIPDVQVRVPHMITEEVKRNISLAAFREFMGLVDILTDVDADILVPFELGVQYEARGLKPADAFIGAYTQWVGADLLVSENRHFLARKTNLPFKVVNAAECLKMIL